MTRARCPPLLQVVVNPFAWDTYLAQTSPLAQGFFEDFHAVGTDHQLSTHGSFEEAQGSSMAAIMRQVLEVAARITGAPLLARAEAWVSLMKLCTHVQLSCSRHRQAGSHEL